jgi:hypothetical protein
MEMTILKEVGELRSLYKTIGRTSKIGGAVITCTMVVECMLERAVNSFMPAYRGLNNLKSAREAYERFSK